MNNVFNKEQMFETSEDCGKYSKSVSYETLVGGTTTIGKEHNDVVGIEGVITRRASVRRGYLPEQGTHTNEETLFASVTCFMRLPRRIQRMLLVMTIPASCREAHKRRFLFNLIRRSPEKFFKKNFRDDSFTFGFAKVLVLALIFTLITTAESRAECTINVWYPNSTTCYNTWKPGVADNCGDGCTYSYNNGKLTVTATKPNAIIPKGFFSPYYYENGVFPTISNIEIAGEFDTIKSNAFLYTNATISGKDGILYLKNVDYNTVQGNTLTGTIIISDEITKITGQWYLANLNATVILPPSIQAIGVWAPLGLNLGENAKIYCGVENCEELFRNVDCDAIGEAYSTQCKNNLNTLLSSGKLLAYPDGCTKMGASGCTKCKNENFKLNDGECDRLRWTPAEAAKVLHDDNTNEVTITFKK